MRTPFLKLAMTIGMCLCALRPAVAGDDVKASKDSVEAKYITLFPGVIGWPAEKSVMQSHKVNVCIIGGNPFGADALDIFRQASSLPGAQFTYDVKKNISQSDIADCHILFVSSSEDGRIASIIERAQAHSVLTVSDAEGFIEKGGIVQFKQVEENIGLFVKGKINLRINARGAEEEHLHIDPQLLEHAAEVIK